MLVAGVHVVKGPSKAEAVERARSAERALGDVQICMSALVDGRVQWMGGRAASRKPHAVGLVRPDSATGGWVIHVYRPADGGASMTECRTLDAFDRETQLACCYSGEKEEAASTRR